MKLKAKSTPEGFILEEVNPYEKYAYDTWGSHGYTREYSDFKPKSYFTDDPDLIEGVIVDSEDYDLTWQLDECDCNHPISDWFDCTEEFCKGLDQPTRLFAHKKVKEEESVHWLYQNKDGRNWIEDYTHENGNYHNICIHCENDFIGHKRRVVCKLCAKPIEVKEETCSNCNNIPVDEEGSLCEPCENKQILDRAKADMEEKETLEQAAAFIRRALLEKWNTMPSDYPKTNTKKYERWNGFSYAIVAFENAVLEWQKQQNK